MYFKRLTPYLKNLQTLFNILRALYIQCAECDQDTFLKTPGKASKSDCQNCALDRSTGISKGNTAESACLCKRTDFYTDTEGACVSCPVGADCSAKDGLMLAELTAEPGYWRPSLDSNIFSPCVAGYSTLNALALASQRCCPVVVDAKTNISICVRNSSSTTTFAHTDEQCSNGYSGALCLVCAAGFVKQGTDCIPCPEGASIGIAAIPLISMLVGLFVVLLIFLVCGKKAASQAKRANKWFGQAKILVSFLQIFSSIPSVLDGVPWPKSFLAFALPLGLANLDLLAVLAQTGCSLNVRFYDKFILHMILPVGCLMMIVLAYFVAATCCIKKNDASQQIFDKETASKAMILVVLLLYPGLSTKIFTMFKCKSIKGIEGVLLVEDYQQVCYSGEHVTYQLLAIIFLCLYVIGIPVTMFFLLWRNKKHLHDESSPKHHLIKNALGGMYTQYEPKYWWFEIFLLVNKTMMCGGLVMFQPGTSIQVLVATLIMLGHLLVVLKISPFESNGEDMSSFLSSLTLTLTTLGGFALMTDPDPVKKTFDSEALAYVLVSISVLCIVSQILITVFVDCGLWDQLKGGTPGGGAINSSGKKAGSSKTSNMTQVQPVNETVNTGSANGENGGGFKTWGT